jgi:hypothetical protein
MSISKTVIDRVAKEMLANAQEMGDIVVVPNSFEVYLPAKEHAEIQSLFNILRRQTEKRLDKELAGQSHRASFGGSSKIVSSVKKILGLEADDFDGNKEYKRVEDFWDIAFKSCDGKINVENNIFELKKGEVGIIARFSSPEAVSLDSQFKTVFTVYTDDGDGASSERRTTVKPASVSAEKDEFATKFNDVNPANQSAQMTSAILKYKIKGKTKTFPIIKEIISVGRSAGEGAPETDLALECSEKISRRHVEIRFDHESNKFFLKSLGVYGTAVNGKKAPDSFKTIDGATRDLNLEVELPERARIALAGGEIILDFESGV